MRPLEQAGATRRPGFQGLPPRNEQQEDNHLSAHNCIDGYVTRNEMLEELLKLGEAVSPKPPAPPPKGRLAEFKYFLGKAGVIGLAIGFIMGNYIGKVVSALVQVVIMPIPGAMISGGD